MYLFNEANKKIEVYSMTPNKDKVENYKKEQLSTFNKNIVYGIETNMKINVIEQSIDTGINEFGIYEPLDILESAIDFEYKLLFCKTYHRLIEKYVGPNRRKDASYERAYIESYIQNHNHQNPIVRTFEYNDEQKKFIIKKYLIFLNGLYKTANLYGKKYINSIISIPKDLYLYELLNQGHYHLIDENISDQIALFDISKEPVKIFEDGEIEELVNMGICSSLKTHPSTILERQVEASQKVLKYIKNV